MIINKSSGNHLVPSFRNKCCFLNELKGVPSQTFEQFGINSHIQSSLPNLQYLETSLLFTSTVLFFFIESLLLFFFLSNQWIKLVISGLVCFPLNLMIFHISFHFLELYLAISNNNCIYISNVNDDHNNK